MSMGKLPPQFLFQTEKAVVAANNHVIDQVNIKDFRHFNQLPGHLFILW